MHIIEEPERVVLYKYRPPQTPSNESVAHEEDIYTRRLDTFGARIKYGRENALVATVCQPVEHRIQVCKNVLHFFVYFTSCYLFLLVLQQVCSSGRKRAYWTCVLG